METSTYIAVSRQASVERNIDTIANNIANASTIGYRAQRGLFQEYLAKTGSIGHRENISFTQDVGDYRDMREGPVQVTSNPLDVTLRGNGYFVIGTPAGNVYTRNGEFHLDDQNRIVTSDGYQVLQANGQPITIPQGETVITIAGDGTVQAPAGTPIGQFNIVRFGDDQALRRGQNGSYTTDQQALPAPEVQTIQGAIEGSNVQPIVELTTMISVQRNYSNASNLIQAEHDRMKNAITRIAKQS